MIDKDESRPLIGGSDSAGNDLEHSAWMRVVSRYLSGSIRVGAYAANLHFLAMINVYVDRVVSVHFVKSLAYLIYSAVLYEISARVVRVCYKPRFIRATDCKGRGKQTEDALALSGRDYNYRLTTERMIYESLLYYGFNLLVALILCGVMKVETAGKYIGLGVLGGFVSFFNFFGAVMLAGSGTSFSFRKTPEYLACFIFMVPLLLYVGYTIYCVFGG